MDPMPYIWLAVIIVMAIVEAVTTQLVSIWFVLGGIVALIVSLFGVTLPVQLIVFVLVSTMALLITRPFVKKHMGFKKEDTNAGRYVGKVGKVIVEINNELGVGQVNVSGSIWTARAIDNSVIPLGANVTVESIEGVKLLVKAET
ncbi:MAG: NfeD family protein [Clostridiales bacterium]|jgi:membrane protein implicated in regulation of membrane protease activity|nr:NfeD family protein [Clostridiales bacterium]